jgi:hypothetical protein
MRHHFVYIYTNTLNQLHNLQKVYKLDINRSTAKQLPEGRFEVQGLLSDEEIERIRCDGYDVEFNEEDSEDAAGEVLKDIGKRAPIDGA